MRTWRGDAPPITTEQRDMSSSTSSSPLILQNWPYHDLEQMHSGLKLHIGRVLLFLKNLIKFVKLCLLSSYTVQNSFNLTIFLPIKFNLLLLWCLKKTHLRRPLAAILGYIETQVNFSLLFNFDICTFHETTLLI